LYFFSAEVYIYVSVQKLVAYSIIFILVFRPTTLAFWLFRAYYLAVSVRVLARSTYTFVFTGLNSRLVYNSGLEKNNHLKITNYWFWKHLWISLS